MPVKQKENITVESSKYGPENPHPLSTRKTELIWEGKYDEWGNRREIDAAGMYMPMQKIETINQPRSEASATGQIALFEKNSKHLDDFRNMLIWGDNKLVMASLLKDFQGKIDLIYIDPPFDVGADFTMRLPIGENDEKTQKEQSILEMIAYRDMWGRETNSYLHMFSERLCLMKELLNEKGSIYVHCDWRVSAFMKILLDEIFGKSCFRNEIIWYYSTLGRPDDKFAQKHDTIFCYGKSNKAYFNQKEARVPYSDEYIKSHFRDKDDEGKICRRRFDAGKWRTYYPNDGMIPNDVWEIPYENSMSKDRLDYPTQKPTALLERIVKSSSKQDDLVADFFCGSGTTGAVAEKLGRRWIMADLGRFAVHTSRKRMIETQRQLFKEDKPYRSFDVYNLGRYERQWWQSKHLARADEEHREVVLGFYRAEIFTNSPSPLLHGKKGPAFIYVDGIDSLLTHEEVKAVAKAAKEQGAKEIHLLSWEFEMGLRFTCDEIEHIEKIKIKLFRIPREIMERNRTEVSFLELGLLEVKPVFSKESNKKVLNIKLSRFIPSLAEVPSSEVEELKKRAMKSGFDFIDFWAVDFDYKPGNPFEHHWQDYRTRKDRTLKLVTDLNYEYPKKGKYTVCVKVIDVFGADTSITTEIDYE